MKIEMIDVVTVAAAMFFLLAYLRIGLAVFLFTAAILAAAEVLVQVRGMKKE